nr:hypothetical protein [uncultured Allomuricauda sp.]
MLKVYQYLTYLFNAFLIIGLALSLYEYFIDRMDYNWTAIPINLLILYVLVSTLYFVRKTQKAYALSPEDLVKIAPSETNSRLDKYITVSNLIVGLGLTLFALYILLYYPINPITLEELLRLSTLVAIGVYGILKINYAVRFLKLIIR